MRWLLTGLLVPCAVATVLGVLLLYPFGYHQRTGTGLGLNLQPVNGEVTAAASAPCTAQPQDATAAAKECLSLTVHMDDGAAPGQSVHELVPLGIGAPRFTVGDKVVLAYSGSNPNADASYQVVDFQRGSPLAVLAVLFAAAVLVLSRWQGVATLAALGLSFLVLVFFVLPAILAGKNPLIVGVVGACLIMFVVLYLTHGLSARTSTAVLGTLVSLALIGGLGAGFSVVTKLTGINEETANLVSLLGHEVDSRGLLLAGLVIGALGVLDDVTVTQTSAVWELRRANPGLSWRELYSAGLRIGRDHASSAVNTLAMAYAGAALPLLLASSVSGRTFGEIVTSQAVAEEVVRTLVGSIGLIASVPLTTALAAMVASHERVARPRRTRRSTPASQTRASQADIRSNKATNEKTATAAKPEQARKSNANSAADQERPAPSPDKAASPNKSAPPSGAPTQRRPTPPTPRAPAPHEGAPRAPAPHEGAPPLHRRPAPNANPLGSPLRPAPPHAVPPHQAPPHPVPPRPVPPRGPAAPPPTPRFPTRRGPAAPPFPGGPSGPDPQQR